MHVAVRVGLGLLVGLGVVLALRAKSEVDVEARMNAFRLEARDRVLGPRRGLASIPSEAEVLRDAAALAEAHDLEVTDLAVRIERDVTPTGQAARIAERLGAIPAPVDVDEAGARRVAPARPLRTTRLTLTGALHGEGFLVEVDGPLEVTNEIGHAM